MLSLRGFERRELSPYEEEKRETGLFSKENDDKYGYVHINVSFSNDGITKEDEINIEKEFEYESIYHIIKETQKMFMYQEKKSHQYKYIKGEIYFSMSAETGTYRGFEMYDSISYLVELENYIDNNFFDYEENKNKLKQFNEGIKNEIYDYKQYNSYDKYMNSEKLYIDEESYIQCDLAFIA
jgi:hypothetical protein